MEQQLIDIFEGKFVISDHYITMIEKWHLYLEYLYLSCKQVEKILSGGSDICNRSRADGVLLSRILHRITFRQPPLKPNSQSTDTLHSSFTTNMARAKSKLQGRRSTTCRASWWDHHRSSSQQGKGVYTLNSMRGHNSIVYIYQTIHTVHRSHVIYYAIIYIFTRDILLNNILHRKVCRQEVGHQTER